MALFDTDILIDHLRGRREAKDILLKFKNEKNYCSVITSGEILFGMKLEEKEKTLTLLNSLEEIPVDKTIVRLSYEIKNLAKGHQLQLYDCLVCASALKTNQVLVTRNVKHYPDKRIKLFVPDY
ncbi:MAG: PIN domain-containing protein [Elusimicrobiota bacterium]